MAKKPKSKTPSGTIAVNRRARHEYHIESTIEAGVVLAGWEVKSLRAGKGQLTDTYILIKDEEAWLLGSHIMPLPSASTHVVADPTRTRKLLLHRKEIARLLGQINQKGFTCVPLSLYWKGNKIKCLLALVKGKQMHDKRADDKDRDWERQRGRIMREKNKQ